jgi:hypothetical protein
MSHKKQDKRKRNSQRKPSSQVARSSVPNAPAPTPPVGTTTTDPIPPKWSLWALLKSSHVPGIIAIAISLGSLWYGKQQADAGKEQADAAREQLRISQQTIDIATGKRTTRIECVDFFPKAKDFKPEDELTLGGKDGFKYRFFRNANALVMLAPALFLNNDGQEPIDAVRVEVSFVGGALDRTAEEMKAAPADWHKRDTPVIRRPAHQEEYTLPRLWQPGECLRLVILKGVLDQISQVGSKTFAGRLHRAELCVVVNGRIAGSGVFSSTPAFPLHFYVGWKPDGFPDEETKSLLESYKPSNLFGERRKAVVPTIELKNPHRGLFND